MLCHCLKALTFPIIYSLTVHCCWHKLNFGSVPTTKQLLIKKNNNSQNDKNKNLCTKFKWSFMPDFHLEPPERHTGMYRQSISVALSCLCGRVWSYAWIRTVQCFPVYMDSCTTVTCVSVSLSVYPHCPRGTAWGKLTHCNTARQWAGITVGVQWEITCKELPVSAGVSPGK